jgi:hypothetical protein
MFLPCTSVVVDSGKDLLRSAAGCGAMERTGGFRFVRSITTDDVDCSPCLDRRCYGRVNPTYRARGVCSMLFFPPSHLVVFMDLMDFVTNGLFSLFRFFHQQPRIFSTSSVSVFGPLIFIF